MSEQDVVPPRILKVDAGTYEYDILRALPLSAEPTNLYYSASTLPFRFTSP